MAKDPAVLWYWSDWNSGTSTLSRFLKGCYMDLLHAQFNNGHLSLEEIKTVLGSDFGSSWPALQKKFSVDPAGNFFNERLEQEQLKRKSFVQSRRNNLNKKSHIDDHMDNHMVCHMENENRNVNRSKKENETGKDPKPKIDPVILPFESDRFQNHWQIWKDYKLDHFKFKYKSPVSEQAALKKLNEDSDGDEDVAIKMIEASMAQGWQGLFPLKNLKTESGTKANGTNKQHSATAEALRKVNGGSHGW